MRATPTSAPARCAMWFTPPAPTPPTAVAILACEVKGTWEGEKKKKKKKGRETQEEVRVR